MRFNGLRSPRSQTSGDDERILPLINVVFLLLIFFMLAGSLTAMDPFEVRPPESASDAPDEEQSLLVLVGADGRLALDGQVLEAAALREAVAARLATAPDLSTRLKADASAEAVRVVEVMELLQTAGVRHLQLLTVRDRR